MAIEVSPQLDKKLKNIRLKNKKLFVKIEKQLLLFQKDQNHPSLRIHKLKGDLKNVWSISIARSFRMIYTQENDVAYFFDIGKHEEVYRK